MSKVRGLRELLPSEGNVFLEPSLGANFGPCMRDFLGIPEMIRADDPDSCVIIWRGSSIPSAAASEITREVLISVRHSKEIE
jgi:hypothetical protein